MKAINVAKVKVGDECIIIKYDSGNWITIPLKFNGGIMTINIRTPTKEEILALRFNWLNSPM